MLRVCINSGAVDGPSLLKKPKIDGISEETNYAVLRILHEIIEPTVISNYLKVQMQITEIVSFIQNSIINCKLVPGQRIKEIELCKELGEKRNRVREALRHLEQDGFIDIVKYKGARVKKISQKEIMQTYDIMGVLEGLAANIAVKIINDNEIAEIERLIKAIENNRKNVQKIFEYNSKFHDYLTKLSGNERLISLLDNIHLITRMSTIHSFYNQEQIEATIREHRDILKAIKNRNYIEVEKLIREHHITSKNNLLKTLNKTL
jgi:DNA-binding GntR family transcriptional regulator